MYEQWTRTGTLSWNRAFYRTLVYLIIVPICRSVLVNRTIDSNLGDPWTGFLPIYQPQSLWTNQTCSGCYTQPDISKTFDRTWNAATYHPNSTNMNITLQFTGVAIWIFFILSNGKINKHGTGITTNTQVNITVDGYYAGNFSHNPDLTTCDLIYNATIFSTTNLANTSHELVIATNDYPISTFINFDWAVYTIDDGIIPQSASSSSTITSSNSGVIVGSTIGGLAVTALLVLIFLLLCLVCRRRLYRARPAQNEKIEGILDIEIARALRQPLCDKPQTHRQDKDHPPIPILPVSRTLNGGTDRGSIPTLLTTLPKPSAINESTASSPRQETEFSTFRKSVRRRPPQKPVEDRTHSPCSYGSVISDHPMGSLRRIQSPEPPKVIPQQHSVSHRDDLLSISASARNSTVSGGPSEKNTPPASILAPASGALSARKLRAQAIIPVEADIPEPASPREFETNITNFVKRADLERFFAKKPAFLKAVAENAAVLRNDPTTDLGKPENIERLTNLSLYQLVIYCDDSGSMTIDDVSGNRYYNLRQLVSRITKLATKLLPDDTVITVRFINDPFNDDATASIVDAIVADVSPSGGTALGEGLVKKILQPLVYDKISNPNYEFEQPLLVCTITDGVPNQGDIPIKEVVANCRNALVDNKFDPASVMFCMSQIGTDLGATDFLNDIRNETEINDVVYCTADQLDIKFAEFQQNERQLEVWLLEMLTTPIMLNVTVL